jgi:translocation and assembly module TamB
VTRARKLWIAAAALAVVAFGAVLAAVLVLRSDWFRDQVRQRIVAEVETATGGRTEIGSFHFDWRELRAEIDAFVLHGAEPATAPPLFRADAVVVGIQVVSVLKRSVDIQYLDVRRPQVSLIVYPDGRTNMPSPKVKHPGPGPVETILELAIGRFSLQNGNFEIAGQSATPFDAQGRDLHASFTYDGSAPSYRGRLSIAPADLRWGATRVVPLNISLALAVEKNQIRIDQGQLATAQSQADFSGAIQNLADFSGAIQYKVRASLAEVAHTLSWTTPLAGPLTLTGSATFQGLSDFDSTGTLHAAGLSFRPDPRVTLRNWNADGSYRASPTHVALTGLRYSGTIIAPGNSIPVTGRIESAVLRHRTIDAVGIRADALDGSFTGKATLVNFERVRVEGELANFDVRKLLRVYSAQSVPWDASASGPVQLSATLGRASTLQLAARMSIAPAATGAPVHGEIDAAYNAAADTLDLGRSFLALPATRADFSGVLGRTLQVRADSRDLNEILPAFDIQSLPVALHHGEAQFQGTVTGKTDNPRITGRGSATNLVWSGRTFDALSGDIDLSSAGLSVRTGIVQQGALHLEGSGSLGLIQWKIEDSSALSAAGSVRNAPATDLLAVADIRNVPLTGTITAEGQVSGTVGAPLIQARIAATKGTFENEPFDRFTGVFHNSGTTAELTDAHIAAGARQAALHASYQHQPGNLATGQLHFQIDSNRMPLDQFQIVSKAYPGIAGTAELHAIGAVDIIPAKPGFHIADLNGTIHGRGLTLNNAPVRDVELTAATRNGELSAHFDSEVAGSTIQGDGQWRLVDDYPGNLRVNFQGIDLERARVWLRGAKPPGGLQITGSAEGTLSLTGPAARPADWKARLEIPSLKVGPGGELAANGQSLALHNAAPIVISMEHDIVKVESARMVGRATDLSLTGTANLEGKNPLDLRVSGRFDLATLQDFNSDIAGSGAIETSAAIRGPISQPQISGRLDIKDAAFNLTEIPVGVSKANGVILFDGTRATIQSFTGESGGGTVSLSGFAGYTADALIFRVHATAHQVRIRYPEDFSTEANASLNLTGSSDSSTLSGRITILRTGFNPHSDFSSILAKSAEPVRTPSAQTGLVANMHFDVQVDTAPDITFETSIAQGLQAEGSLRLRGTGTNPSVLGRVNITQGEIVFFGTTFSVNQGSISFYNPVKIDPLINIDLDTKARGVDVILNISGPIDKLSLTPRSDPPMQFSDIVALLATGRSPGTDYATLMASPASPQSLQQMGASALLGQAIASPVTGRLQRFFGITRVKIDPTLNGLTTGVEGNPQARLTIEQQVTPEITFTYITDVTNTNPLIIQVEWAVNHNWSAVALRDENGLVGLNFVYKRRFK